MAGGKTNTTRIEQLEDFTKNLVSRLDVHDETLKWITEGLKKGAEVTAEHGLKIVSFEQKFVVLVDFNKYVESVSAIQRDLVAFRKDLESLQKWKEDLKKEKDESSRRRWAFGPNAVGALISGFISLLVALLVVWLNKRP